MGKASGFFIKSDEQLRKKQREERERVGIFFFFWCNGNDVRGGKGEVDGGRSE